MSFANFSYLNIRATFKAILNLIFAYKLTQKTIIIAKFG